MEKKAERSNVLTESENKNFIHAILNAVTKGYSDSTVVEDVLDLVRRKEISKGILSTAPEALRSYASSFSNSLEYIADKIGRIEIMDEPTIRIREDDETEEETEGTVKDVEGVEKVEDDDEDDDENVVKEEMKEISEDEEDDDDDDKDDDDKEDKDEEKQVLSDIGNIKGVSGKKGIKKATTEEEKQILGDGVTIKECQIEEDWDLNTYDDKENKLAGVLILNFNSDVNKLKKGSKVVMDSNLIANSKQAIYNYFKSQYKNIKASNLDSSIFKGNPVFSSLITGKARVAYEIKGAF